MGRGGFNRSDVQSLPEYSWDEITSHNTREDRWIVVDDCVYDVTRWGRKHPGGEKILASWGGQDASDAWYAFHIDKPFVAKFMKPLIVGRVKHQVEIGTNLCNQSPLLLDFHKLRKTAEDMDLFTPNPWFYMGHLAHIIALDLLGCWIMWTYGTNWIPFLLASLILATAQIQAGWTQHDYGHLSVFGSSRWNHWIQVFIINFIKGASAKWWNYRHFNHHSKPNTLKADPDVRLDSLFLVGKILPVEWGTKRMGHLPFQHQHRYFYLTLPPLLLPIYFNFEIPYFLIKRKQWSEMLWMSLFFLRWQIMLAPLLGVAGVFALFLFVRFLESHWFVWATQMSHLPMTVDYDQGCDWVTSQLKATCNVEQSWFNDWWSGHLNFQIEHHLFPTMPRHNLHKIAPLCQSLCEKHNLDYQNKPLLKALQDIIGCLKESGELWLEAYNM
nr:front-end fatty acid desaturase group B [Urechis unicinctus]